MNSIELKAKWQRREPSPGMWMSLSDITVAEMIRDVGLDWSLSIPSIRRWICSRCKVCSSRSVIYQ